MKPLRACLLFSGIEGFVCEFLLVLAIRLISIDINRFTALQGVSFQGFPE
jgi:hypothetical protein